MCDLCEKIEEKCFHDEGKTYICKCKPFNTYDLVFVDPDTCSPICVDIKYCPNCGRKLDETL